MAKRAKTADEVADQSQETTRRGKDFWGNHGHDDNIERDGRKSRYPVQKEVDWRTLIPKGGGENKG